MANAKRTQGFVEQRDDPENKLNVGDFLKNGAIAFGIYLFFCGWIYLYTYFGSFGISINDLSIPLWSYYIYGFQVLVSWNFFLVLLSNVVALVLLYLFQTFFKKTFSLISITILILCFPEVYFLTRWRANTLVQAIKSNEVKLPTVYFHFTKDFYTALKRPDSLKIYNTPDDSAKFVNSVVNDNDMSAYFLDSNRDETFSLLLETSEEYIVVKKIKKGDSASFEVFRINKSKLNFVKVNPTI